MILSSLDPIDVQSRQESPDLDWMDLTWSEKEVQC